MFYPEDGSGRSHRNICNNMEVSGPIAFSTQKMSYLDKLSSMYGW
jgi:hypothetical protein